jgi:uncharacterized lipoprotein YbaY
LENSGNARKNSWLIAVMVLVALILVGILSYAMLTAAGILSIGEAEQPIVFIEINNPTQGANLDLTWSTNIHGTAGGLFEGNLVVQALDAAGNILAQKSTLIDAPDAGTGGAGPWSVDLTINAQPGSQGQIVAFATSPRDGSIIVEDKVAVGYGEFPTRKDLVNFEDHLWMLASLNQRPPIQDSLINLQFSSFQAGGFGGCNNYRTSFERNRETLNFGFVTSTAKECELPAGILTQESAYFNALEQISAVQMDGSQLVMTDRSGGARLVFHSAIMGNILGTADLKLPDDAVVYIQLMDSSTGEIEDSQIAEQAISSAAEFPIPYSLIYNPKRIIDDHTYTIVARIEDSSGNLLFTNSDSYQVITGENPSKVDIMIKPSEK